MMRLASVAVCVLILTSACASAGPILHIDAPAAFTPGTPFDLIISLTDAESLALYNVELILSSTEGEAGDDFQFVAAAEPADRYVFAGEANDGFAYAVLADSTHRITLSDLLITGGVTTAAGVNEIIAMVTVETSASMSGDIIVTAVSESLELDATGFTDPINGYAQLQADLPEATIPVPEPSTMSLAAMACVWSLRRIRRRS